MTSQAPNYRGYRFPPEIISHAVWLYHRFCLSFRDAEDLLAQRGITVTYETIRQWCQTFGPDYARRLRRRRVRHCQVAEQLRTSDVSRRNGQNIPSCSFAASDIRSLSQGGSQTMSTCASVTPGNCFSLLTTSTGRLWGGGAARRRQRHANADHVVGVDGDFVDEAEFVDVDWDLWVKDRREHLDNLRLHRESPDGVTTLEDRAGCRVGIRSHSRRLLGARRVFVGDLDDIVHHGRRSRYSPSVDTISSFASTAERSVCQARLAHLTRAG